MGPLGVIFFKKEIIRVEDIKCIIRRSHSSLGEYRPQASRYRDRGGIDYGADYGDNYSSYANGGGGLAGGYGLSSRSNPEIAHRKYYEQDVLDYERYWDGRY